MPAMTQGAVKQIVGSTLKDLEERCISLDPNLLAAEHASNWFPADHGPCAVRQTHNTANTHRKIVQWCSEGGDGQLITNFEAAAPASYFADLYAKDDLHGGHVIMLGSDPESR